ncbi:hypothetical protein [Brevundimonas sp.]|uniref:hypothetical protein n=1 Tax=Brevundimonas sp. TaxID=1871086 RepID=UPI001DCAD5BC|nr:hypothetical protein [Brevundimonas sp.]MBL0946833.1 hypothetical protein [Brevundimonas sp.]
MGEYEYCRKGITMRGIRRAFRDEMERNADLVKVITKAGGVTRVSEIGEIAMKNQGEDLRLTCVSRSKPITIWVDVQIDKTFGKPGFKRTGKLPAVEVAHKGATRTITVAPEKWFRHTGNARYAQNMVTFESLLKLASEDFYLALLDGIERAEETFEEMLRPRMDLPHWVILRLKGF